MRHRAALFSAMAMVMAAVLAVVATPAHAVVRGFEVRITEVPRTFSAGSGPGTITVVASTSVGRICQKVRWSMLMEVEGVDLDQVRVQRVEETGSFPLQVEANGDTARLTDARLDPGALCVGRTVTARYEVSFDDEADEGQVRFQAEVFDARQRLLQRANATSQVLQGEERAEEAEQPEATPSPTQTQAPEEDSRDAEVDQPQDEAAEEPAAAPSDTSIAAVPAGNGGSSNLLGVGLIIGALLIFMGVGLLLRLRTRSRVTDELPTMTHSFNPAP